MATHAYEELNEELRQAGVPAAYGGRSLRPIEVLVNAGLSAIPYEEILLTHAATLEGAELEMVVRALTEKGVRNAGPLMVSILRDTESRPSLAWATANALSVIQDQRTYADVLDLAQQQRLGAARQMLLDLLGSMRTEASYEVLVGCLDQEDVRGHAVAALGRLGRVEAISVLEALETSPGKYEDRAKATALKRLGRLGGGPV